ncbi:unnamed protein product [Acanthoscelides obtectus]|uniref:Uncharacterized protein n=1 Tax=Acanthoscelides obtectus TaxID=200917 RepID=A0A9P0L2M6_ACAOB|nr:unnamed protein product [Acanthoscelides obtectus]CAK1662961.1 hypothetical protein AOBTE_LOCUS23401 [Acanthoscelides obtectus]
MYIYYTQSHLIPTKIEQFLFPSFQFYWFVSGLISKLPIRRDNKIQVGTRKPECLLKYFISTLVASPFLDKYFMHIKTE